MQMSKRDAEVRWILFFFHSKKRYTGRGSPSTKEGKKVDALVGGWAHLLSFLVSLHIRMMMMMMMMMMRMRMRMPMMLLMLLLMRMLIGRKIRIMRRRTTTRNVDICVLED